MLLVFTLLACFVTTLSQFPPNVVDTNTGKVDGLITDKAKVFRSIPYARPPVKELRWQDPLPPFPWPGILQVTEDPPGCPQSKVCQLPPWACPKKTQEDCLYLNVFTPLTATPSSKLPVMVFMHGGGFVRGYSGGLIYDGQYMVNQTNVILVTINYRLGALGFLVYGSKQEIGGNYGLKDQRFAFKWIQDNIANFGGNPNSVTIFGQSAGGVSVAAHMCSVKSSGLFHRGIIESNPFGVTLKEIDDYMRLGKRFAKELGCGDNDVSCVKEKSVDAIIDAEVKVLTSIVDYDHLFEIFMQWTPYMDGIEVDEQPLKAFKEGRVASIPLIMGSVGEEAYIYAMESFPKPVTTSTEYHELQLAFYGPFHFAKVAKQYPFTNGIDNRGQIAIMGTDNPFWCPTRYAASSIYNSTKFPVWLYNFDHAASFNPWPGNDSFCDGHSCHGEELAFLFHNAALAGYNYTEAEEKLSQQMMTYWTNFARYGDPNGESGGFDWPQYTSYTKSVLRFLTPKNTVEDYRSDYCDFWDQIGYNV
ncbi:crystal protein-like [Dysidea avara]|uniref:crystal protein-like n=1 Tax=Dysidea avara TaxID=196820 RepID=UPI003318E8C9